MEGNASVYQVYPVSRVTGEGRAEFGRAWEARSEQEGAAGRGGRTCVENINPLREKI